MLYSQSAPSDSLQSAVKHLLRRAMRLDELRELD
jgi:hypothetical protein